MTITLSQDQMKVLERLSSIYLWWENPEKTTETQPLRVFAQVMNLGTWEDWNVMLRNFDKNILKDVLKSAKKGWFDENRWHFWHLYLGLCQYCDEVPPLPKRIIPLPNGKVLAL